MDLLSYGEGRDSQGGSKDDRLLDDRMALTLGEPRRFFLEFFFPE